MNYIEGNGEIYMTVEERDAGRKQLNFREGHLLRYSSELPASAKTYHLRLFSVNMLPGLLALDDTFSATSKPSTSP